MQNTFRLLLSCMTASVCLLSYHASAAEAEWQCQAGAAGGWDCVQTGTPGISGATGSTTPARQAAQPVRDTQRPAAKTPVPDSDTLSRSMDWVALKYLTPEQCSAVSAQCRGAYIEPPADQDDRGETVFGTIHAYAAESELRQDPEIASFSGGVTLRLDDRHLRADRATYQRSENRLDIDGNVQYREPGLLLRGDSATIETARNAGEVRAARFVMHAEHTRGKAERVQRNPDGSIDLDTTTYTQCEPGKDDWQLAAETLHLDRSTGQGTARNARIEVGGIPILYTPYLRFPISDRRMSGLLWPSITSSSRNGIDFALPYYFNLAPNYDATLVPRYVAKRGMLLGGELRYLNGWGEWSTSGVYLPDDNAAHRDRWIGEVQHSGSPLPGMSTRISYADVSDKRYLRDLGTMGLETKRATHLSQLGQVGYRYGDRWQFGATVQQYEVLDPELVEPYQVRPRLQVERAPSGEPFVIDYGLSAELSVFDHPDPDALTGKRLFVEPSISYPMEWASFFIRPTLGYQAISYRLDEKAYGSDSPSAGAPILSLDTGYFLERDTRLFGRNLLQTLEPRLYYLRVGYDSQNDVPNFDSSDLTFTFNQLFRQTRFSGHDRIADANQASLSVTTRMIDNESGRELLTASIGQIFYFEDRRVTVCDGSVRTHDKPGCRSPDAPPVISPGIRPPTIDNSASTSQIATELRIQPSQALSLSATTLWDTRRSRVDEGGVLAHWNPVEDTVFNIGYRYRREQHSFTTTGQAIDEDIDQADISAALPVADNWRVFARYQYDFTNTQSLESLAGFEYNACCWSLRMVYQQGLDWDRGRDYGFYLQFVLRGLGGLGKNIDQLLQHSIFGFGERREADGFAY